MATSSPFPFLDNAFSTLASRLTPPAWLVQEVQQRIVLVLNHVLQQEPEAQTRLKRQSGRVALLQWREIQLPLRATPAGLVELASTDAARDLTLSVVEATPLGMAQKALKGEKPDVRIEGDVQLAADVSWLVDHLRWDIEEDLSRIVGDVAAHRLGQLGRGVASALRAFVAALPTAGRRKTP